MRASTVALLAAVAMGCGGGLSPGEVCKAYFRSIAHDPARSMALLSPEFHERHGIRRVFGTAGDEGSSELPRAQLGWLQLLREPDYRVLSQRLSVSIGDESIDGDQAVVTARVDFRGAEPFAQRFLLSRSSARSQWKIDAIEQTDVTPGSRRGAFAAAPTEAARRAIAGPRPDLAR